MWRVGPRLAVRFDLAIFARLSGLKMGSSHFSYADGLV